MAWLETLGRIPKIMESNINDILDKCQDPVKMSKQMLRDYKANVAKVKDALGELMADLDEAEKNHRAAEERVRDLTARAMRAVQANDREAAEYIVAEKQKAEVAAKDSKTIYDNLLQQTNLMKAGYNKLVADIEKLEAQAHRTAAKTNMAKAIETSNKAMSGVNMGKMEDSFAKMEAEADRKLSKANAMRDIDSNVLDSDAILQRYAEGAGPSVTSEVDALFAAMGKSEQPETGNTYQFSGTMTQV